MKHVSVIALGCESEKTEAQQKAVSEQERKEEQKIKSQLKKGISPIKHWGGRIFRSLSGPSVEVWLFWECAARVANNDVSSVVSSADALLKGLILYQLRQETCTHMQTDMEKKTQIRSAVCKRVDIQILIKKRAQTYERTHAHTSERINTHTNICRRMLAQKTLSGIDSF